ncbi:hypothetical protein Bca52824_073680 [Brassica carinata]|uniref:Uncharacterized protein n=1 Tax=Brassica carinata TaxID=52824 RepID=A0A8X7U878_BRACI|nr:hypothetical protein Bca52824_073680 [Brassica carinata]
MRDQDKEKNMENPDVVHKALANHNQTASLDTGRLEGRCESHHDWAVDLKRFGMSPKGTSCQRSQVPKVVSCQRMQVTKRYKIPKVTNIKRYEDQEVPMTEGVHVPNGVFETSYVRSLWISLGLFKSRQGHGLSKPGPKAGSGKEVDWAIEPDFIGRSHLDSIQLDGLVFGMIRIC